MNYALHKLFKLFLLFQNQMNFRIKKNYKPQKKKKFTSNFIPQYECLYRLIVNMVSKMLMSWSLVKWHLIKYSGLKVRIVCRRSSIFRLAAEISTVLETTSEQSHRQHRLAPPLDCMPPRYNTDNSSSSQKIRNIGRRMSIIKHHISYHMD